MQQIHFGIAQQKVDMLRARVGHLLELTVARVSAHIQMPAAYPVPNDPNALEHKLLTFYQSLTQAERKKFIDTTNVLNSNTQQANRQKYGDLMDLDFKNSSSILEQIKSFPLPEQYTFTHAEAEAITGARKKHNLSGKKIVSAVNRNAQPTILAPRTLTLTLEKIKCIDPQDLIKDEIFFTGFTIDALGIETPVATTSAGKYKKGDSKELSLKLKDFDLREAGFFPQNFLLSVLLFDKDAKNKDDEKINRIKDLLIDVGCWGLAVADVISIGGFITVLAGGTTVATALIIGALAIGAISIMILIAGGITALRAADFSETILDFFIFDNPPLAIGEFVDVTKRAVIQSAHDGLLKGNYDITFRWERTA